MKIVDQSVELVPEGKDYLSTIEQRGRVCYKSEDKITDESSEPFVKGIIKRQHNSVLEMNGIFVAVDLSEFKIDQVIDNSCTGFMDLFEKSSDTNTLYISGTFRAIREFCTNNTGLIADLLFDLLTGFYPVIVEDVDREYTYAIGDCELRFCSNERHDNIKDILSKEDYGIANRLLLKACRKCFKFVTNRAVSHELVRHRPNTAFLQESQRYVRYDGKMEFINPTAFRFSEEDMEVWKEACIRSEELYTVLLKNNAPQASRLVLPNSTKTEILVCATLHQWRHIFFMRCATTADPSMQEIMVQALELFVKEMVGNIITTNKRRIGDDCILPWSGS